MASHIEAERLNIVATLDTPVQLGQKFDEIPPHMKIGGAFRLGEGQYQLLFGAMSRLYVDTFALDSATIGRKAMFREDGTFVIGNHVENLETISKTDSRSRQWFALHALIKSVGKFEADNKHPEKFSPRIIDAGEVALEKGEAILFRSLALFASNPQDDTTHVIKSFDLHTPPPALIEEAEKDNNG